MQNFKQELNQHLERREILIPRPLRARVLTNFHHGGKGVADSSPSVIHGDHPHARGGIREDDWIKHWHVCLECRSKDHRVQNCPTNADTLNQKGGRQQFFPPYMPPKPTLVGPTCHCTSTFIWQAIDGCWLVTLAHCITQFTSLYPAGPMPIHSQLRGMLPKTDTS